LKANWIFQLGFKRWMRCLSGETSWALSSLKLRISGEFGVIREIKCIWESKICRHLPHTHTRTPHTHTCTPHTR
jgi:hypothetical protein